jgi:hypothetical protein
MRPHSRDRSGENWQYKNWQYNGEEIVIGTRDDACYLNDAVLAGTGDEWQISPGAFG